MSRRAKRAASYWLWALAAVLSGLEVVLPLFADNPTIPRLTFALLSFLAAGGALVARWAVQRSIGD